MFSLFKKSEKPQNETKPELSHAELQVLNKKITDAYKQGQTVEKIAQECGLSTRLVITKLVRFGLYKKLDEWRQGQLREKIGTLPKFKAEKILIAADGRSGVAISSKTNQIALVRPNGDTFWGKVYAASEILSVEVISNGRAIHKIEPSTKIGSAIIGGLLFGGAGAVVGAISGKNSQTATINTTSISLHITISDPEFPLHDLLIIDSAKDDSNEIQSAKNDVAEWCATLDVLVHQATTKRVVAAKSTRAIGEKQTESKSDKEISSAADEIAKILELKKVGAITEEEFTVMKRSIIQKSL